MPAERVHIGGLRWGKAYATWPLGRLVIGAEGVKIEPSRKVFFPLFRVLRLTTLDINWCDIEAVFPSKGLVPSGLLNHQVSFVVGGRTMVWWCPSRQDASEVLAEVGEIAPEKMRSEEVGDVVGE